MYLNYGNIGAFCWHCHRRSVQSADQQGSKVTPRRGIALRRDSLGQLETFFLAPTIRQFNPLKMLYLVGLGLSDETDITVKGLDIVKKASRVYLEAYTSILLVDQSTLVRPRRR